MLNITKNKEPKVLVEHRAQAHANYSNIKKEDDRTIRDCLLAEQRNICCYCMRRIRSCTVEQIPKTKIEHYKCQTNNPDSDLDYGNIMLACMGGHGSPKSKQFCDTYKGDDDLIYNPSDKNPDIEALIKYRGSGEIHSLDKRLDHDLNTVLNLNYKVLKNYRKDVWDGFVRMIPKKKGDSKAYWVKKLKEWSGELDDEPLKPYCGIVIYHLRKRIRRF